MNERVRAAVVGLAKAGPAAELTPEELPFVSREGETPETRFLLTAAAADLWEQAGREAAPAPAAPEPCDDEAVPAAPSGLAAVVAAVCEEHPVLLREVCERLADRGLNLPPRTLPAAFEVASSGAGARGGRTTAIRAAVAAAAGPRGRWLAGFNPDWAWVLEQAAGPTPASDGKAPADLVDAFAADHFGRRLNALRRWRAADPAAARAALEETWKGETAFRRAALLETFEIGLSAADESFLEAALADRSKAVPAVAENLLLGLPDSAFAMSRRRAADALLDVAGRLKAKLVVTLPPALGQQLEGDGGIDWGVLATEPAKGAAGGGRGVRAERLVRALAGVPPAHWTERFGREPAALIALAESAEHGEDVLAGWVAAAARFAATDAMVAAHWAPALSAWASAQLNRARRGKKADAAVPAAGESLTELIAALPPAAAADFVRPLLTAKAVAKAPEELGALLWAAVPDPWPDDFARAVVAVVEAGDGKQWHDYWKWQEPLVGLLERLPPAVLAELAPGWPLPHDPPAWLDRLWVAARLRRRIHQLLP